MAQSDMERITISLDADLAAEFDRLIAERGVRHGQLNLIDVEINSGREHRHGYTPVGRTHGPWI